MLIQSGGEDTDAHTAGDDPQDTAAYAAFCGEAYGQGKFPRAVVHTAGGQCGVDVFGIFHGEQLFTCNRVRPMQCEDMGDFGQILTVDGNGAGAELAVQNLLHGVGDHAVSGEHIGEGTILVACHFFGKVYRFVNFQGFIAA